MSVGRRRLFVCRGKLRLMGYAAMLCHAVAANAAGQLALLEHDLVCCHYHIGLDRDVRSLYFFFRTGTSATGSGYSGSSCSETFCSS